MHQIENFLDSLHQAHLDNAERVYVAKTIRGGQSQRDISPVTNFVFEFFLYNSLYAVDWETSYAQGQLVHYDRNSEITESKMQNALEKFCRQRCGDGTSKILTEAFVPLAALDDLSGEWTRITTDDSERAEEGRKFFSKIAEVGQLAGCDQLKPTKRTFELISSCRYFSYGVRNNIFHGSKSLGEIHEADQARRIGVYDLFLRCLNSLFFLSTGRAKHGAALCQLPMIQNCGSSLIELSVPKVNKLLTSRMLKPEDSKLHWKLFRSNKDAPNFSADRPRAMFYPSAGKDFFFPLLVGLPYCTDYYFYEEVRHQSAGDLLKRAIEKLAPHSRCVEVPVDNGVCFEFEYDHVVRHARIVNGDNREFLKEDILLTFYFHRGDSHGEGGSNQLWDSELLPQLLAKSNAEDGCRILTDGQPGDLLDEIKAKCKKVSLPDSHRGRDYYYGVMLSGE